MTMLSVEKICTLGSVFGWFALLSVTTFFLSLLFIPWLVCRLSPNFFIQLTLPGSPPQTKPSSSLLFSIFRNLLGYFLLVAGITMLFLPGQGLLTIILALLLISFPGKKKVILAIISKPGIQKSMDWVRKKSGKMPFSWPPKRS